ncbi:MAG TPA: hypothetical protein VMX75_00500, partial [Spirochaetia bacterium]|nr:hypothetical protein [Spirochaetia bacterium]
MIKWSHRVRLIIILSIIVLLFGGVGARLFYIQVLQHDFFTAYAEERHLSRTILYPIRGTIFDRSGKSIIAKSKRTKAIFVDPSIVNDPKKTRDPDAVIGKLAELLELDAGIVRKRACAQTKDGRYCREVMLERKPTDDQIRAIESFLTERSMFQNVSDEKSESSSDFKYRGVYFRERDERVYPSETVLCHVLGYMRDEEPAGLKIIRDDIKPQRGIELASDRQLSGAEGWRIKEVDQIRREVISEKMR